MNINTNNFNRFEFKGIVDKGFDKGKRHHITGINGYHGVIGNIIGKILEVIFKKTVSIKVDNKTYYLNCKSFCNWYDRVVDQNIKMEKQLLEKNSHDKNWVQETINNLCIGRDLLGRRIEGKAAELKVGQEFLKQDLPTIYGQAMWYENDKARKVFQSLLDKNLFNESEIKRVNEVLTPFFNLTSKQGNDVVYVYIIENSDKIEDSELRNAFNEEGCLFFVDYVRHCYRDDRKLAFNLKFLNAFDNATNEEKKKMLLDIVLPEMEKAVDLDKKQKMAKEEEKVNVEKIEKPELPKIEIPAKENFENQIPDIKSERFTYRKDDVKNIFTLLYEGELLKDLPIAQNVNDILKKFYQFTQELKARVYIYDDSTPFNPGNETRLNENGCLFFEDSIPSSWGNRKEKTLAFNVKFLRDFTEADLDNKKKMLDIVIYQINLANKAVEAAEKK